jgi:signal transduction histidine kinase
VSEGASVPLGEGTRERLVEASRLATVGRLVPALVHQLSTPLASIALRAESLEGSLPTGAGRDDGKARRYLQAIVRETGVCRELMALAREFARPVSPDVGDVDVNALCRDAAGLVLHEAMRKQVEVRLALDERLPPVEGREGRIRQAVLALVLNAVDASPTGGAVELATTGENGAVAVSVTDAGEGVAPADAAHLGRPFASSRAAGLGLGLLACRAVADDHGGSLGWDSTPGSTRFVLRLPARESSSPGAA